MKPPTEKNYCYMFEMITPKNIIVVRYTEEKIVLHGVRNMDSLQEEDPEPWAKKVNYFFRGKISQMGWPCIKVYPLLKTLDDTLSASRHMDPTSEGTFFEKRLKLTLFKRDM